MEHKVQKLREMLEFGTYNESVNAAKDTDWTMYNRDSS